MSGADLKEIEAIQADMVCMEGMLEALIKGALAGARIEYIGNSLEILRDYLGQRAERLDVLCSYVSKGMEASANEQGYV